jgi:hypothetical protein
MESEGDFQPAEELQGSDDLQITSSAPNLFIWSVDNTPGELQLAESKYRTAQLAVNPGRTQVDAQSRELSSRQLLISTITTVFANQLFALKVTADTDNWTKSQMDEQIIFGI